MKVAVIGGFAQSLLNFRGSMIKAMVAKGHRVVAMAPDDQPSVRPALAAIGAEFEPAPLNRTGLNPLHDLWALRSLTTSLRRHRVDAVLCYTAKAVVYGLMAARIAGIPLRCAMITGAGSVLQTPRTFRQLLVNRSLRALYGVALRGAHLVFFQNQDDETLFRRLRLIGARQRLCRIDGSGVDLDQFAFTPSPEGPPTFLLVGRLLRDKGIFEYVEAARIVRQSRPDARFRLLGMYDNNPSAIQASQVQGWVDEGVIDYQGTVEDVRPQIAAAHVCVLPSYNEGLPRSILEGMSMGRPIITTDAPGCRETVVPGVNGFLAPVKDPSALAKAMLRALQGPPSLAVMGAASRALAERRFDVHLVNRAILGAMNLL